MKRFVYLHQNRVRHSIEESDDVALSELAASPSYSWVEVALDLTPARGDIYDKDNGTFSPPTPVPDYGAAISKIEYIEMFTPAEFSRWTTWVVAGTLPAGLIFPLPALDALGNPALWSESVLKQKMRDVQAWMDYSDEVRIAHPIAQAGLFILGLAGILNGYGFAYHLVL